MKVAILDDEQEVRELLLSYLKRYEKEKNCRLRSGGRLSDLAPTLLELMGLPVPDEMTGKSLIEK